MTGIESIHGTWTLTFNRPGQCRNEGLSGPAQHLQGANLRPVAVQHRQAEGSPRPSNSLSLTFIACSLGLRPPLSSHASILLNRTSCDVAGAFTVTVSHVAGPGESPVG
jgi:hypothetical protein